MGRIPAKALQKKKVGVRTAKPQLLSKDSLFYCFKVTGGSDLKCSGWISVPKLASAGRQSWSGHQLKGLASLHLREVEKAMTTLLDALVN